MSCSGRLPVYVLFTAVFFPRQAGTLIFGLYLGGIVAAILVGLLLSRILFRGMTQAALIMELPAYHKPIWKNIWRQTWDRTSGFLRKAGTTILTCSMIVWLLMAVPVRGGGRFTDTPVQDSLFAVISQAAAPVFAPLGFDSWQSTGSLLTGIVAKEVVVSTMAQAYAADQQHTMNGAASFFQDIAQIGIGFFKATFDTLRALPLLVGVDLRGIASSGEVNSGLLASIRQSFDLTSDGHGTLAALTFLVFVLLYTPCISALTVARNELGAKWMALTAVGQFVIAWLAGALVFQIGLLVGG
jgi:ferrous iron transport protein B